MTQDGGDAASARNLSLPVHDLYAADPVTPIFLLSLPRSGSTLLQRMLASHSAITTTSEPWILLPLLYSLRPEGAFSEYGHATAVRAIEALSSYLPDGRASYLQELRQLAVRVYTSASAHGSVYFLDKTPRYMLVADELLQMFPDSKFIVLWRNPLAVVASIIDTWVGGRWMPYLHKVDLFEGLERLLAAYEKHTETMVSVRYEDLVTDPSKEMMRLVSHLGLGWEIDVLTGASKPLTGPVGDKTGARLYDAVSRDSLVKWQTTLATPVRRVWCRRYLHWIGRDRLQMMGYDIEELVAQLEALPSSGARVVPDLWSTAKGVAWSLGEPNIVRKKLTALPSWRRVYSHS